MLKIIILDIFIEKNLGNTTSLTSEKNYVKLELEYQKNSES